MSMNTTRTSRLDTDAARIAESYRPLLENKVLKEYSLLKGRRRHTFGLLETKSIVCSWPMDDYPVHFRLPRCIVRYHPGYLAVAVSTN